MTFGWDTTNLEEKIHKQVDIKYVGDGVTWSSKMIQKNVSKFRNLGGFNIYCLAGLSEYFNPVYRIGIKTVPET